MIKLKPCPFCGKLPVRKRGKSDATGTEYWWIACENEHCPTQPMTAAYIAKGADVRAWNRRTNDEQ